LNHCQVGGIESATTETIMNKMTWYAAGALVAWVLVGAAAIS
jgi:hypothetical protein